jgi:glycosyltransferase involved in cell wall biosynthesis
MSNRRAREMLVFDSAFTHRIMVERDLFDLVLGRDLDGYFDHVWTVHPVASLLLPPSDPDRYGRTVLHQISDRHSMIEGRIGRFRPLRFAAPLNFLLAQWDLLRRLTRLIGERDIRIVRAEDAWYNGLLALLLARRHRRPLMIGVWGNPGEPRKRTGRPVMRRLFRWVWVEERVERFVLRRADRVIVQNENNREWVLAQGVAVEKTAIFRLGNLIHEAHFTEPAERQDGGADLAALGVGDGPVLICVARLEETKLTDHVVRLVRTLRDRGRAVKAVCAGDGSFRGTMETLAQSLGVGDSIVFCGNRDQSWLARVLPKVTAVVSPSTGRSLVEAALAGAPIAAYDVDWQAELIESGKTGELVPLCDHAALADAVERIIDRPERAREIGANARRRALAMMDPAAADRAQIAAYEELLDPASAGAGARARHAR